MGLKLVLVLVLEPEEVCNIPLSQQEQVVNHLKEWIGPEFTLQVDLVGKGCPNFVQLWKDIGSMTGRNEYLDVIR